MIDYDEIMEEINSTNDVIKCFGCGFVIFPDDVYLDYKGREFCSSRCVECHQGYIIDMEEYKHEDR